MVDITFRIKQEFYYAREPEYTFAPILKIYIHVMKMNFISNGYCKTCKDVLVMMLYYCKAWLKPLLYSLKVKGLTKSFQ